MKAIVVDKASVQLIKALKLAETEIAAATDPKIKSMYAAQLVLSKINSGEKNLYDPSNSADMIILTMAEWD
jgi:hypothetical protein